MSDTPLAEDRATRANFFDQFDDDHAEALTQGAGWEPTLQQRMDQNFEQGTRDSPLGVAADIAHAHLGPTQYTAQARREQDDKSLTYQQMKPADGWTLDYLAGGAAYLAGGGIDPSTWLSTPLKFLGIAGRATEAGLGQVGGRLLERGAETALTNTLLDTVTQGAKVADNRQDGFDWRQLAISAGLGGILGIAAHGVHELRGGRDQAGAAPAADAATPPPVEPNHFDQFDEPAAEHPVPDVSGVANIATPLDEDIARTNAATAEIKAAAETAPPVTPSDPPRQFTATDLKRQYSVNGAVDHVTAERSIAAEVSNALDDGKRVSATIAGERRDIVAAGDGKLVDSEGLIWNAAAPIANGEADRVALSIAPRSTESDSAIAARMAPATGQRPTLRTAAGIAGDARGTAPRLEDLVERLTDAASDATAFRQGRMSPVRGGKKLGQFDLKQGVVRVGSVSDLPTITHEIAHDYETNFGPALKAMKQAHQAELKPLAYAGAKPGTELSEGFAEFFRHFVTSPAFAEREAPGFFKAFTDFMDQTHPDKAAVIREVRAGYRDWLGRPSGQAITADIVSEKTKGFLGRLTDEVRQHGFRNAAGMWLDEVYTKAFDRLHPTDVAVKNLIKIAEARTGKRMEVKSADNPYRLQRLAVDASQAGMVDLMHGVVPFKEVDPVGPSMFDSLQLALGKRSFTKWDDEAVQEFGAYLVSRRALIEFERFERGEIPNPPGKFSKGDYQVARTEFEAANPQWDQAAKMLYEFQDNLLFKKHDAGFLTDKQLADFMAKPDYVPFQRDMQDFGEDVGVQSGSTVASTKGKGKASIVQAFRGSNRSVINPLESIMRDALETANLIARNETFLALDRLAQLAGPGGGSIAERIPSHQLKGTRVDVTEVIEAAAREQGLDARDTQLLRDLADATLGEHVTATLFRAGEINEKGEPIIYLWRNGKKQALRLADGRFGRELYATLTGMTKEQSNYLFDVLTLPTTVLRAGITTSPEFLIANYIRDQMSAWILSGEKFTPGLSGAKGMFAELTGSDIARMHAQVGGISGGANVSALHDARIGHDIQALRKKGFAVERLTSAEGLFKIAELSETGTRLGVFEAAYKRGLNEGLRPYEALVEAGYSSRDYIDFGRHGSKMIWARKLVPFFNAALQGLDKTTRTMIAPFIKYRLGQTMTGEETRALGTAAKAWAKVTLGLGGASLALSIIYRDDPDFEEISPYLRATHWPIKLPTGKWLMIPKPFELAIPANIIERTFEAKYKNDPVAWERMLTGLAQVTVPPTAVPGIDVAYELRTNYDFFRDRAIVPEELQGLEPALQFNAWTSEFGKRVGAAVGVSPLYIDHAITGFGGSWGQQILNWSNALKPNAPTQGWDDFFVTKRFIKDISRGSTSSNQFWDLIGRGNGSFQRVAATFADMQKNPTLGNAEDYLNGKPEDEVAFAILNADFDAGVKRMHPLNRAKDAVLTIAKLRNEMASDNAKTIDDQSPIVMTPAIKGQADDVLARLQMVEARNALIATGVPGWSQKAYMDTAPIWNELQAASPAIFDEIKARYAKAKVYSEAGVRKAWPEAQKRIMQDRGDAFLGDLATDARYD